MAEISTEAGASGGGEGSGGSNGGWWGRREECGPERGLGPCRRNGKPDREEQAPANAGHGGDCSIQRVSAWWDAAADGPPTRRRVRWSKKKKKKKKKNEEKRKRGGRPREVLIR